MQAGCTKATSCDGGTEQAFWGRFAYQKGSSQRQVSDTLDCMKLGWGGGRRNGFVGVIKLGDGEGKDNAGGQWARRLQSMDAGVNEAELK